MVNFSFLDCNVPRSTSYGVYISQLIRFALESSHVDDFNIDLAAKLLKQGHRYHKLRKAFPKFYRRHFDIVSKYNVGLKHLFCKAFQNLNFMATWCINSEILSVKMIFFYYFKKKIVH